MSRKKDLTGKRFGRLIVVCDTCKRKNSAVIWECKCDCGNVTYVTTSHLKSGAIRSCGCLKVDVIRATKTIHGKSKQRIFRIWRGMIDRCYTPSQSAFRNYGGRGIGVCKEWKDSFSNFLEWATKSGYNEFLTIDRMDVNGDYTPENCRWITRGEQNNNTRQNHLITIDGRTYNISQWAKIYNINDKVIRSRIRYGWKEELAVTTPLLQGKGRIKKAKGMHYKIK